MCHVAVINNKYKYCRSRAALLTIWVHKKTASGGWCSLSETGPYNANINIKNLALKQDIFA